MKIRRRKVLIAVSVASMIDQFNLPNIRLLLEMGFEVHVACNFKEGNTCDRDQLNDLLKLLLRMQVQCHQWDCSRNVYSIKKCIRAYKQINRLIRKQQFAWIHCQSPVGGALSRIAAHRSGLPVIYTVHGFHFYKGAPLKNWLLYYPAEKLLARWTNVIITVNREDYRFAKKNLKAGKVCTISGVGIDVKKFLDRRKDPMKQHQIFCRKYQIPQNAVILLSVGELSKRKNHLAVLTAIAKLRNKNIYYLICGQGKLKKRIEERAQSLGILQRVRLVGFQNNTIPFYQNADLFVFPSIQEGLPVALMEAMAAGLACVVSDVRGNRELIDCEGGIRYKTALEDALAALLENESLRKRCGRYNQQKIRNYDLETVNSSMKRIYTIFDQKYCPKQG